MTPNVLPTKRQAAPRGVFRKLHAITRSVKKQRVSATAEDIGGDVPGMGVSGALMFFLGIHVVVIGGLFFHHMYLEKHGAIKAAVVEDRQIQQAQETATTTPVVSAAAPKPAHENLPQLAPGELRHMVVKDDNYERVAVRYGVDIEDLRAANNNVPLRAGLNLRIPPKKIVAVPPDEMVALQSAASAPVSTAAAPTRPVAAPVRAQSDEAVEVSSPTSRYRELSASSTVIATPAAQKVAQVSAEESEDAPAPVAHARTSRSTAAAVPVKKTPVAAKTAAREAKAATLPKATAKVKPAAAEVKKSAAASSKRYTVKEGESIYRIAKRMNVDEKSLMKANHITNPTKLRAGATIVIPN